MPEMVNSRVGSFPGTRGAEGTMVWPLPRKNSRKSLRIWLLLSLFEVFMRLAVGGRARPPCGDAVKMRTRAGADSPTGKGYQAAPEQTPGLPPCRTNLTVSPSKP